MEIRPEDPSPDGRWTRNSIVRTATTSEARVGACAQGAATVIAAARHIEARDSIMWLRHSFRSTNGTPAPIISKSGTTLDLAAGMHAQAPLQWLAATLTVSLEVVVEA
jgi:hypothetical protein